MERVRTFIRQRVTIEDRGYVSPCWIWQRVLTPKGYAKSHICGYRKNVRVHRAAYEAWVGPIPEGLTLDHLCRVKCCVNPAHLEPVTAAENTARCYPPGWEPDPRRRNRAKRPGTGKGGWQRFMTHCAKGHEWTPENTLQTSRGRRCAACYFAKTKAETERRKFRRAAAKKLRMAGERAGFGSGPSARTNEAIARLHDKASNS